MNKFGGQAADTGHWRGSNESQKATVRIDTGGTPEAPGLWELAPEATEGFTAGTFP